MSASSETSEIEIICETSLPVTCHESDQNRCQAFSPESASFSQVSAGYSSQELELNKNTKKLRSTIHDHFKFQEKEGKYKCNYCNSSISKEKTGSTGNLRKHLDRFHKNKIVTVQQQVDERNSLTNFIAQTSKKEFTQTEFEKRLIHFIVLTDQPFTIVESQAFQSLIALCNPNARAISSDTVKRRVLSLFEEEKLLLHNMLNGTASKFSCALDCWDSSNQFAFQGVMIRWVNDTWDIEERVLDLDILDDSHTGKNLANSFMKVLQEFGIANKLLAVTTDNASNCDTFFSHFSEEMQLKNLYFDKENQRVRCLAHIVNLACQDAISVLKNVDQSHISTESYRDTYESGQDEDVDSEDEIDASTPPIVLSLFERLRQGIVKIRKSTLRRASFQKICEFNEIKHRQLVLDVSTRWNSTYFMLKRALKMKLPLESTLQKEKNLKRFLLTDEEWSQVEQMVKFLKPFKKMTIYMSEAKIPTLSLSSMVYMELYNHLENYSVENGHSELFVKAAEKACTKLNKYYPSSDRLVYVIGTILDPRCKLQWYTCNSTHFPASLIKSYKSLIRQHWELNYKPKSQINIAGATKNISRKDAPDDLFTHQMKKAKLDRDELQIYLDEKAISTTSESMIDGPLVWWKEHQDIYPCLSKMARDFLGVSGTGISVERLFSCGPDLLSSKRQAMKPDTIRKCLCLKGWLRSKNQEEFKKFGRDVLTNKMFGN